MARKIQFAAELDASGFSRGLKLMEASAAAANGRMSKTLYQQTKNPAMTESQVRARAEYEAKQEHRAKQAEKIKLERAEANKKPTQSKADYEKQNAAGGGPFITAGAPSISSRRSFGAASSMFVSAARDTAASLASGAPITQVIAQQAPQVLQALTMMKLGMVAIGASAAVAGAVVAGFLVKSIIDAYIGTKKLEESFKNLAKTVSLLKIRDAIRAGTERGVLTRDVQDASIEKKKMEQAERSKDSTLELEKQKAIERSLSNGKIDGKEKEIALEKELLQLEIKRAEEKLASAKQNISDVEKIKETELQLFEIEQQFAELDKNRDPNKVWKVGDDSLERDAAFQKLNLEKRKLEMDLELLKNPSGEQVTDAEAKLLELKNKLNKPTDKKSLEIKQEAPKPVQQITDSLLSVGNFLSSGRSMVGSVEQQTLDEIKGHTRHLVQHGKALEKIAANTGNKNSGSNIEIPD